MNATVLTACLRAVTIRVVTVFSSFSDYTFPVVTKEGLSTYLPNQYIIKDDSAKARLYKPTQSLMATIERSSESTTFAQTALSVLVAASVGD